MNLQAGANLQTAIDTNPGGTTFCLKPGIYRPAAPLVSKSNDKFIGEPGAIISGSRVVTSWVQSGANWVSSGGPNVAPPQSGVTKSGWELSKYPDDVYLNNVLLRRVSSVSAVGPGKVFVEYSTGKIYIGDNPTGNVVEIATVQRAFKGLQTAIQYVTIKGLIVEKFANGASTGAIEARDDWLIENNEVRMNHGAGITALSRTVVRNNNIHHNGQLGVASGGGSDILFEGNEIAYNNTLGFSPSWEAGGSKFLYTTRLTLRNNYVHHNDGPGLWTDVNNIYSLFEGNLVEYNSYSGIFHEVSYDATIRNNISRGNGFGSSWVYDGAGILAATSVNVEIYDNIVENNKNGVILYMVDRSGDKQTNGPHLTQNNYAHHNVIKTPSGVSGLVQSVNDNSYFTSKGNRFNQNTYHLSDTAAKRFLWMNSTRNKDEWKGYGQDLLGVFLP